MDLQLLGLMSVALALMFLWCRSNRRLANLPPGPGIWWALNTIFSSESIAPYAVFNKLAATYGGIFFVKLGAMKVLVLHSWPAIKEALVEQAEAFSGRPATLLVNTISTHDDIASAEGSVWKENRRFALLHLRSMGVGKATVEDSILVEADKIKNIIDSNGDGKLEMKNLFFMPMLNVLWSVVASRKFDYEDPKMVYLSKCLKELLDLCYKCADIEVVPFWRFFPWSSYARLQKINNEILQFTNDEVEKHIRTYKDGIIRDLIDIYLSEKKELKSENGVNDKRYLQGIVHNMFNAGIESIQSTLLFGLLYMATWQEIQEKVHEELDRVIGRDRPPSYSDRKLMPYIEAVLFEVHRYASVSSLSIPHCNIKEAKVQGYTIPKRTYVFQHIRAVHFDPKLWGDPEIFRPERFIDESGNVKKPEYLIPFSIGARRCIGETLSVTEIFIFFTCILQRYHLRCPTGEPLPSIEPHFNIGLTPKPFSLTFKRR